MNRYQVPGDPVSILLVEDDDGEAKAVARAFRKLRVGNPIIRAIDGVNALEILRAENGYEPLTGPVILLVDVNMPRMNGVELITELRKDPALRRTVAFMLTTSDAEKDITASYDAQISGYIRKQEVGADFQFLIDLLEDFWTVIQMPRTRQ